MTLPPVRRWFQAIAVAMMLGIDGSAQPTHPSLVYDGSEPIPSFELQGKPARIHTQGLCVTDDFYYVTGRLDGETRRPLLLRFDRSTRRQVEMLDLAAGLSGFSGNLGPLNHPSGFDFEGNHFWIALSESRPESRSIIVKVPYRPGISLEKVSSELLFEVEDHIGAIALDRNSKRLYGANWDTKAVYVWETSGHLVQRLARDTQAGKAAGWFTAVQDWKWIGPGRLLAGGLDKRPARDPALKKSVLEIWDLDPLRKVESIDVPAPPGMKGEVANEGCALWMDFVYFLPADLGSEATIYRFRLVKR